jgi:GTPase SAR1 family protein
VTHAYYRDAQALLLLYDVSNQTSFDNIRAWLSEIRQYAEEDVVIMLLGNKVDKATRVVTKEQGEKLAKVCFFHSKNYLESSKSLIHFCQ